jgi:hypothetical protein
MGYERIFLFVKCFLEMNPRSERKMKNLRNFKDGNMNHFANKKMCNPSGGASGATRWES